ncbi:MAG: hypothetical protein ABIA04_09055 [Pseudomonadota bacterium]
MQIKHKIISVFILSCLCIFSLKAQENSLSVEDIEARINFIESSFDLGQDSARFWYGSWIAVHAFGMAFGAGALLIEQDLFKQGSSYITMAQSALGLATDFIIPMVPAYALSQIQSMPADIPEEKLAKLLKAEALLKKSADIEAGRRSIYTHIAGAAVAAAGGLVIYYAFDEGLFDSLMSFSLALIGSEIQLFTTPTKAISDWEAYNDKFNKKKLSQNSYENKWFFSITPISAAITRRF